MSASTGMLRHTYPNRIRPPLSRARSLPPANLRRGVVTLAKIIGKIGIAGDYRRVFWRMALPALRAGRIEDLIAIAVVAHHMIRFARDCTEGRQNASFYADRPQPTTRRYASRLARHSPAPNWLRLTMPLFWSLAAPSSTLPDMAPSPTLPSK